MLGIDLNTRARRRKCQLPGDFERGFIVQKGRSRRTLRTEGASFGSHDSSYPVGVDLEPFVLFFDHREQLEEASNVVRVVFFGSSSERFEEGIEQDRM